MSFSVAEMTELYDKYEFIRDNPVMYFMPEDRPLTREQGIGLITNAFQRVVARHQYENTDRNFLNRLRVEMDLQLMNTDIDSSWYSIQFNPDLNRLDLTITPPMAPIANLNIQLNASLDNQPVASETITTTGNWAEQVSDFIEESRPRANDLLDAISDSLNNSAELENTAIDIAQSLYPMTGEQRRRELYELRVTNDTLWSRVRAYLLELDNGRLNTTSFGDRPAGVSARNNDRTYTQAEVDKILEDALKNTLKIETKPIEEDHRSIKL